MPPFGVVPLLLTCDFQQRGVRLVNGRIPEQQLGGVHAEGLEVSRETRAIAEREAELGAFVAQGEAERTRAGGGVRVLDGGRSMWR